MKLVALRVGLKSLRHPGVQLVYPLWPIRGVWQAGRHNGLRKRANESGITFGPGPRVPTTGELLVEGDSAVAGIRLVDAKRRQLPALHGRRQQIRKRSIVDGKDEVLINVACQAALLNHVQHRVA